MTSNPESIAEQLSCEFQDLLVYLTRAATRLAIPVTGLEGTRMTSRDQRPTASESVFGKVCWERHDFTTSGEAGRCPLDAGLSQPARYCANVL